MSSRSGMLLMEAGLCLLLLGVLLVPVLDLLRSDVRETARAANLTQAFQAARAALDSLGSLPFEKLDDSAAAAAMAELETPPGVPRPVAEPIKLETLADPSGGWLKVKIVTVRVPNPQREIVLRTLVVDAR